jgi:hypothetical protein
LRGCHRAGGAVGPRCSARTWCSVRYRDRGSVPASDGTGPIAVVRHAARATVFARYALRALRSRRSSGAVAYVRGASNFVSIEQTVSVGIQPDRKL